MSYVQHFDSCSNTYWRGRRHRWCRTGLAAGFRLAPLTIANAEEAADERGKWMKFRKFCTAKISGGLRLKFMERLIKG